MTITQMATYFDVLQDKYGSPYFINSEKSLLLNRAQVLFIKELLPADPQQLLNLEATQNSIMEITPLIIPLGLIAIPANGIVTYASIQTALTAFVPGGILWRTIQMGYTLDGGISFVPVRYVRHNDWFAFLQNYFKNPDNTNPKVVESYNGFQIAPINVNAGLYITVLKYPVTVDIDGNISSDLPDFTHDRIVAIALELAGVGTRDQMLNALIEAKNQNGG